MFTMTEPFKKGMYTGINQHLFTGVNATDEFARKFIFAVETEKCTIVSFYA